MSWVTLSSVHGEYSFRNSECDKNTSERMLIAHGLPFGLGGSALYNTVIDILDLTYFLALILKAARL